MRFRTSLFFSCSALFALIGLLSAFQSTAVPPPAPVPQPPKIALVKDISALTPVDAVGNAVTSDGLIYPGEHLLIEGQWLTGAAITIDNIPLAALTHSDTLIRVQVPRGLSPISEHQLRLTTPLGQASYVFDSSHYIAAADTDDNRIHLLRTDRKQKGYIDKHSVKGATIDHQRVLLTQLSPSAALLYSFGIDDKVPLKTPSGRFDYQISMQITDLTAPETPQVYNTVQLSLHSQPVAVSMLDTETLMLVGAKDIALVSVTDEAAPSQVTRFDLLNFSDDYHYIDAIAISAGNTLVALETYHNQLVHYDLSERTHPVLISQTPLYPELSLPVSVDLEADAEHPERFWVLAGGNLRTLRAGVTEQFQSMFVEGEESADIPYQLRQFAQLENQLVEQKQIELPHQFVPFYAHHRAGQPIYVSGINGEFVDFETLDLDLDLLKKLVGGLFGTLQFGRILAVDPNAQTVSDYAKGLGLYYHLDSMPGTGPVFPLYKLSGSMFAPFVKVSWGIGVKSRGTFALRNGHYKSIFPPYSVGHITVQY